MWFLCKTYGKEFGDPWFESIDPITWLLMYQHWLADMEEEHKFARQYAILTGAFSNYEMAQNMYDAENPDYKSSDKDFDESTKLVEKARDEQIKQDNSRRRRAVRVTNG